MNNLIKNIVKRAEKEHYIFPCRNIRCDECKYTNDCLEGEKDYMVAIDNMVGIVQEEIKKYNNGWIPVSERLPDNDDEVLCWYEYRIMQGTHVGEMKRTYGIGYYFNHYKHWGGEVSCGVDCKVIAWQPLPEPYKKSK